MRALLLLASSATPSLQRVERLKALFLPKIPAGSVCTRGQQYRATANHRQGAVRAAHQTASQSTTEEDQKWMSLALELAQQASDKGEVPVGAVLVHEGRMLAAEHNRVEETRSPTAHAEMLCLQQAASDKENWRLLKSCLYVTLEPCPMCAGALLLSRVGTLVYGTRSPLMGADGSWISILPREQCSMHDTDAAAEQSDVNAQHLMELPTPFALHPQLQVRRGVLQKECRHVMQQFFKRRRTEAPRQWQNS
ncbi:hypothetical protein WJX73_001558 [Symbiochloris irregularis]|uniref:tRNA(adenine(34)) deaminase n=1 Tax=Symbiochloris irregularis TaxID=706552 RepID=A0AAW1P847_9CHLO